VRIWRSRDWMEWIAFGDDGVGVAWVVVVRVVRVRRVRVRVGRWRRVGENFMFVLDFGGCWVSECWFVIQGEV